MSEVKLPTNIEAALENLNRIVENSKTVPLRDSMIMVDKNSLIEILTKINREKHRIEELRNDYLIEAEEEAKSIIADAKLRASEIVESALSDTSLESDMNIQVALEIKENAMAYLHEWISILKQDYNVFFRAAKEAEYAVGWIEDITGLEEVV